eukprot:scaffold42202_cov63-Phaeocystis_antarctica.AAC.1
MVRRTAASTARASRWARSALSCWVRLMALARRPCSFSSCRAAISSWRRVCASSCWRRAA